ncbi:high frequency lysogenization protein HflD [Providencia sp. PROV188]|uniref:High frequency lysogenization protein HflD homolog n=1 Tax=Providencia alcalifaciens TaxID=126385 RepID=A0A4R3NPF4_9GAMM|nr:MULTISPECIES: high frequency lysogenization protein HflD [Providencia]MBC5790811.1 high frequency lysogenization protein HflD [Providencia sp. JUb39]MTB46756.1 high frequency lysogenization protein HflD [Providencia sp. wls1950]MTB66027.1 high frequency lysogenization protein HflD [Providencia sp. wls1943]MTC40937.1 high frequency lysogenization protein HflD [Providencia sp. wls1921]TCT36596.1 high frequency lysogenization protein [Providencia alcalifaciens]
MAKNYYDITLALAGICQASLMVQKLAHEGTFNEQDGKTMVNSLTNMNPSTTLDVFGNDEANLKTGLTALLGMLTGGNSGISAEMTRYMLSIMALERRLSKDDNAMNQLGQRIEQFERQASYFEPMSEGVFNALAGIYVDVVSPAGPRIQVTGSPDILKNTVVQAKVRATLLAGIRCAVLWQQVGGSRLQLMFSRSRLSNQAKQILSHL